MTNEKWIYCKYNGTVDGQGYCMKTPLTEYGMDYCLEDKCNEVNVPPKRFMLLRHRGGKLYDCENNKEFHLKENKFMKELCDLLNELHEENLALKQRN